MFLFNYKNYLIPSILFYLIPLGLVTGPFLPDLFLSLIALLFLLHCIADREFSIFKNNFALFFILFYFLIIFSSSLSNFLSYSLGNTFFYFRYFFYIFAISYLCTHKIDIIDNFLILLLITLLIVVFDGYFEFLFNKNIIGISSPDPSRILSFFHAMIIGSFLSKILPLLFFYLIYKERSKLSFNFIYIFISITYILIFLSGERSAFMHASLIFILLSLVIKDIRKLFIYIFSFTFILLSLITLNNEIIKERMVSSVIDGFGLSEKEEHLMNDQNVIFFSPSHDKYVKTAYQIFLNNKFIGSGPNTFRYECHQYSKILFGDSSGCNTHPHNTYAQLLAETGILGLLLISSLFIYVCYSLVSNIFFIRNNDRYRYSKICLLTYFLIALFPFTPTGNFFTNWIGVIYFLPVGIFLSKFVKDD